MRMVRSDDDGDGESPCQPVIGPTVYSFIMTGTSMDRNAEHDDGGDDEANLLQKQRGRLLEGQHCQDGLDNEFPPSLILSISNVFSQGQTLLV